MCIRYHYCIVGVCYATTIIGSKSLKGLGHVMSTTFFRNDYLAVFDWPYHRRDFSMLFSERRFYFDNGLLNFVAKQQKTHMVYD